MQAQEVYELFRKAEIKPEVHLIAMDPLPDHIQAIERMVSATGGYVYPVRNEAELARALDRIFDMLPVLSGVEAITGMLNEVVAHLNGALHDVQAENYGGAEAALDEGKKKLCR